MSQKTRWRNPPSESETAKPKSASQSAYRARKRNEAKKAKKAAAKEEWEDVEDEKNGEIKQPKVEDEDLDMTDMYEPKVKGVFGGLALLYLL